MREQLSHRCSISPPPWCRFRFPSATRCLMSPGQNVGNQARQLSAADLARNGVGCESGGEGGRRRAHVYGSGAALECRCEPARRHDGPGEDFSGMETRRGMFCCGVLRCGHGRHFGTGLGGDAHDNCISLPGSLALCRCDRACRGGIFVQRVVILIRPRWTQAQRRSRRPRRCPKRLPSQGHLPRRKRPIQSHLPRPDHWLRNSRPTLRRNGTAGWSASTCASAIA